MTTDSQASAEQLSFCDCCEKWVSRIHWMEWDNDLSWLCDDCADQAIAGNE